MIPATLTGSALEVAGPFGWSVFTDDERIGAVSRHAGRSDRLAHDRLLHHAADVLARTGPALTTDLADLILAYGGDTIAPVVADARRRQQLGR